MIVGAFACPHTPQLLIRPPTEDRELVLRVHAAFARVKARLEALRPDAIVLVGGDHVEAFFLDGVPALAVYAGEACAGEAVGRDIGCEHAARGIDGDQHIASDGWQAFRCEPGLGAGERHECEPQRPEQQQGGEPPQERRGSPDQARQEPGCDQLRQGAGTPALRERECPSDELEISHT